jgi:hypothetical protein
MASQGERLDGTAKDKKKFLVLLTAGLISSLIMLDLNIVAVSLPSIFSAGLFLVIWALLDGNTVGWGSATILWRLAGAAVLLAAFFVVEIRQERPMVDFSLFRQPTFLGSTFAMLGYAGGAQVLIFFLPLFLQNAYGFSPAPAGLAMLPFTLPMFLTPGLVPGWRRAIRAGRC